MLLDFLNNRNVFLFDFIYDETTEKLIEEMLELNSISKEPINLIINSPGGVVTSAFAIIDIMEAIESPVNTIVLGDAMSASVIIASSGAKRYISKNSQFMVHEASGGSYGKVSQNRDTNENHEYLNDKMFEILGRTTNKTAQQVKDAIGSRDVYMTAQEAIDFGLVDGILDTDVIETLKLSESIGYEMAVNLDTKGNTFSDVPLLQAGTHNSDKYGKIEITIDMLEAFKANFEANVIGTDVSIDLTHENDDGEKPAVGWVKGLDIIDGVLSAKVKFNEKGQKLIAEEAFKYASAEYVNIYRDSAGKPHSYVLKGATLTNRPVIKNKPIKLSEKHGKENIMNEKELIAMLKAKAGIDVTALQASVGQLVALQNTNTTLTAQVEALKADSEELKALKVANSVKAMDDAFESVVAELKEYPVRKSLVVAMYKTPEELIAAYKDMPAVVAKAPIGENGKTTNGGVVLTEEEKSLVTSGQFTEKDVLLARQFERVIAADEDTED